MIEPRAVKSFIHEVERGINPNDVYKIALYTSEASLGPDTTEYTPIGEVVGKGYVAGGKVLIGFQLIEYSLLYVMHWKTNPKWKDSTITARGALIYNATRGNIAVSVFNFGADMESRSGGFHVVFPEPNSTTGLIRLMKMYL